ncbi:hypothetical protein HAX54_000456 [Datura stramonium]|uniref:Uncharacterized protein n=1 Tax=Datura stramonium TaxID=4076 RepID=A0ABS8T281_DATST|nr:hypothetical protein [Datura stramonium]
MASDRHNIARACATHKQSWCTKRHDVPSIWHYGLHGAQAMSRRPRSAIPIQARTEQGEVWHARHSGAMPGAKHNHGQMAIECNPSSSRNRSCKSQFQSKQEQNNDMACEEQSNEYERMEAILHAFLERESNLEKDVNSSMPMELSTPQEEMAKEEISSSMDEPKYLYDHNENCGIEE